MYLQKQNHTICILFFAWCGEVWLLCPNMFLRFNHVICTKSLLRTWVAQSVKHQTLDFGSGHDLMICEFEPLVGLHADGVEPAWGSLSLLLSVPLPHTQVHSLSLKNK